MRLAERTVHRIKLYEVRRALSGRKVIEMDDLKLIRPLKSHPERQATNPSTPAANVKTPSLLMHAIYICRLHMIHAHTPVQCYFHGSHLLHDWRSIDTRRRSPEGGC